MRLRWIFSLTLIVGCSSTVGPDENIELAAMPDLDVPFELEIGERAFVEETGIYLRFVDVADDSRCPSNALILCVWEGDGAVVVEVEYSQGFTKTDTLHTTLDPKVLDLGAVILELEGLDPYPETVTPIPLDEYVATFVVRGTD